MSERKVLNKYYPPDFDPSKIPRMKLPRNRQYTVRLMAPFNMRCATCGEYIYKGKKFNARKEDVENDDYLGVRIYRFYIKCTRCLQEISFKTDPKNTDYEIEAGATRNFMALKLAEEKAKKEEDEEKEEEANNPMKLLENRTEQSKRELELLESLEDLKDLNRRQRSIDFNSLLSKYNSVEAREKLLKLQEDEDEQIVKLTFRESSKRCVEEIIEDDEDNEKESSAKKFAHVSSEKPNAVPVSSKASSVLANSVSIKSAAEVKKKDPVKSVEEKPSTSSASISSISSASVIQKPQISFQKEKSVGVRSMTKKSLMGLVRVNKKT